jgi:hypothetical protein
LRDLPSAQSRGPSRISCRASRRDQPSLTYGFGVGPRPQHGPHLRDRRQILALRAEPQLPEAQHDTPAGRPPTAPAGNPAGNSAGNNGSAENQDHATGMRPDCPAPADSGCRRVTLIRGLGVQVSHGAPSMTWTFVLVGGGPASFLARSGPRWGRATPADRYPLADADRRRISSKVDAGRPFAHYSWAGARSGHSLAGSAMSDPIRQTVTAP